MTFRSMVLTNPHPDWDKFTQYVHTEHGLREALEAKWILGAVEHDMEVLEASNTEILKNLILEHLDIINYALHALSELRPDNSLRELYESQANRSRLCIAQITSSGRVKLSEVTEGLRAETEAYLAEQDRLGVNVQDMLG